MQNKYPNIPVVIDVSTAVDVDWKDRVTVLNLVCFIVIIGGLAGLGLMAAFRPDIFSDPAMQSFISTVTSLILLAFGVLTGKEVVAKRA